MNIRSLLEHAYRAALEAASPARLLAPHLGGDRPDFILAFGKAALPMARAALEAYPGVTALVIAPRGTEHVELPASATLMLSSHPVPDDSSAAAAEAALERLGALQEGQHALVLVSGGGSALMAAPDGVTLEQKGALTRELLRAGADIGEINTVRKHVSRVKGGQLAAATRARVTALLISDVVGDDPSVIASGPTVPDATTFAQALAVLDRYGIAAPAARQHLQRGVDGQIPETPDTLPHVTNTVIGSNRHLLEAAQAYIEGQGVRAVILSDSFEGEASELARAHAAVARSVERFGNPVQAPVVLLSGGEATVTLRGVGVGGRNQEFALALLLALGENGFHALSAGSDGVDGSSPAAGSFLTPDSLHRARAAGLNARDFLERNDSGSFFAALNDALITGPSGHNLNDLRLIGVGLPED
ncbi:glycerate kinase type-2 family protein [Deinococcus humi]|uniref:Hydroxypyruvate reductase n=1 Tax=Deinococcus humi TaxID=662880 RepID=A0A7W8K0R9_9DEIO|nr:glycerate kinase [Deinococcus humi]MBB5365124.1 hydroxypyruvate reductase [Deinococcus humi]GGO37875.1 hydroxypyruvate reductase, putative [Deinococcus humi]